MNFPDQCIPETKKTKEFGILCVKYGLSLLDYRDKTTGKDSRLWHSFNGERTPESTDYITKTHGVESRAKFVSYKVSRTKQDLLEGEWLRRPLSATITTVNIQAKVDKMEQMDLLVGAMLSKNELQTLKDVAGVDVMEGVQVPQDEDDPVWQKSSPKDKQEEIMQVIVNEAIPNLRLKSKFSDCFRHARVVAKCFAKIEINEKGKVDFITIDSRDTIYEEIENDDFLEKSTIKGARQWMPIHEVLMKYTLSETDRKKLENCRDQPGSAYNDSRYRFKPMNNQCMVEVVHVEWKSSKPSYYKIMPKTPNQLEYDPEIETITKEIPPEIYEKNKAKYDRGEANGEFTIEVKYEEDLREGTSLGRMVFVDVRRKPFQMRRHDAPAYIMDSSYIGCLFNTSDGVRISLQELMENFNLQFDICEYQIMKELNRAKGRILAFDLAAMPKNKTLVKLVQEMTDDGVITLNSMAAGNVGGRNLDLKQLIQEADLGFSSSFPQLIQLQNQILANLDRITGINEFREGAAPASSTLGNAQQGLQNSRTITEPLFFRMQEFVEKCMTRIVAASKISYAFYNQEEGEQILGTNMYQYMKITQELGYRDYAVHIEDGAKYNQLRNKMDQWMEYGINSKQITMADAAKFELAETTIEAKNILEQGFAKLQEINAQMAQQQQKADAEANEKNLQMNLQISRENREDTQNSRIDEIEAKINGQMAIDNNKAGHKIVENRDKSINQSIFSK